MYYIRWKNELRDPYSNILIKAAYFRGNRTSNINFCWAGIKEARCFASLKEAMDIFDLEYQWLQHTNVEFIHPLNFELLCAKETS